MRSVREAARAAAPPGELSMPTRFAMVGAPVAGAVGAIVGLVIGLIGYAPTAVFAAVELAIPQPLPVGLAA